MTQNNKDRKANNSKTLYRSKKNHLIGGVAGGIAEYFGVDPLIIRIIFVLLALSGGSGIVVYIILWILIPQEGESRSRSDDIGENIKQGANKMVKEIKEDPKAQSNGRTIGGLVLIVIGAIFLIENFFPGFYLGFSRLWPLILVAIGLGIMIKS